MPKQLTPQQIIDAFQNLTLEEQIAHKKAVDLILGKKREEAQELIEKLSEIEKW